MQMPSSAIPVRRFLQQCAVRTHPFNSYETAKQRNSETGLPYNGMTALLTQKPICFLILCFFHPVLITCSGQELGTYIALHPVHTNVGPSAVIKQVLYRRSAVDLSDNIVSIA